jgi:hypothetical protein
MPLYEFLVLGLCLPAGVAAAVLLATALIARFVGRPALGDAGVTLALGAGYIAGHAAIHGWPPIPPLETTQWLLPLAVLGTALGLLADFWRGGTWLRGVLWLLVAESVVWVFLRPLLDPQNEVHVELPILLGVALGVACFWRALEALVERTEGPSLTLALTVTLAAAAVVLLLAHDLIECRLAGALLAASMGCLLVGAFTRKARLSRGGATVCALLLAGLGLDGHFYAGLPTASAILVAIAPLGLWLGQLGLVKRLGRWPRLLALGAAVMLPLGAGVGIALVPWLHDDSKANMEELMRERPRPVAVARLETRSELGGYRR